MRLLEQQLLFRPWKPLFQGGRQDQQRRHQAWEHGKPIRYISQWSKNTVSVFFNHVTHVSLPFRAGMTLPTALAAPVDDGIMLLFTLRPPRQSLLDGPSTVF